MSIQIVPVTAANEAEWKRRVAASTNQVIQKLSDAQLESLAALEYTGNAGYAIVVNATEDGFELSAAGGGGTTTNALTINNGGAGAASGATFNGSAAVTISYNTVGAAASSHSHTQSDLTGLTTADSPQFAGINLGHASDTTLTRVSAGVVAIEGVNIVTTAGGTFTGDISVPAEAYGSGWNGSNEAPTKNDVYDKIEALTAGQWRLAGTGQTATGVWDQAVDGTKATVDFAGLAGFTDIMVMVRNVTQSVSGVIQLRASVDNGSTFYGASGDYVLLSTAGAESNDTFMAGFWTGNATAARSGVVQIPGAGVNGAPKPSVVLLSASLSRYFVASTSPINAVRILPSGGGNLTGGKIYCFAR